MKNNKHIQSFNEATENLNISGVMKRIKNLDAEYKQLKIDWIKTGNTIPTDKEYNLVNRKRFLESFFNELGVEYNKWYF